MTDYYVILNIQKTATEKEIKKAYHKLATKYHPDKNSDLDAIDRFKEINEAYEILGNNLKRSEYDYLNNSDLYFGLYNNKLYPKQQNLNNLFDIFSPQQNNFIDNFFGFCDNLNALGNNVVNIFQCMQMTNTTRISDGKKVIIKEEMYRNNNGKEYKNKKTCIMYNDSDQDSEESTDNKSLLYIKN
jgi:DnaJ-class molecular chaperone